MAAKVLLIDDDPDIQIASSLILESKGYQVVTAKDGLEGLGKIKMDVPDLMILDLMMPRMDGFAVCKEMQKPEWDKYQHIPRLILTSVREEASYIEKPVHPDILLDTVGRLLKEK
jgi:DNA-binding response OmpR family regulator